MRTFPRPMITLAAAAATAAVLAGCGSDAPKPSADAVSAKLQAAAPTAFAALSPTKTFYDCLAATLVKYSTSGSLNDFVNGKTGFEGIKGDASNEAAVTNDSKNCATAAVGAAASATPDTSASTDTAAPSDSAAPTDGTAPSDSAAPTDGTDSSDSAAPSDSPADSPTS